MDWSISEPIGQCVHRVLVLGGSHLVCHCEMVKIMVRIANRGHKIKMPSRGTRLAWRQEASITELCFMS